MAHAMSISSAWYEDRLAEKLEAVAKLRDQKMWGAVVEDPSKVDEEIADIFKALKESARTHHIY